MIRRDVLLSRDWFFGGLFMEFVVLIVATMSYEYYLDILAGEIQLGIFNSLTLLYAGYWFIQLIAIHSKNATIAISFYKPSRYTFSFGLIGIALLSVFISSWMSEMQNLEVFVIVGLFVGNVLFGHVLTSKTEEIKKDATLERLIHNWSKKSNLTSDRYST
jgi:hypothetical protein